ncbi:MAG: 50S ribosomal protein L29 [Chloroflexota bacterium]
MAKKTKTKTAITDIRKLTEPQLKKELEESYRRLFALNLQKETLQLANHREIPRVRRAIARFKTIERQRELSGQKGPSK